MRRGKRRNLITIKSPGTPTEETDGSLRPASPTTVGTMWVSIRRLRSDESLRMGIQEGRAISEITMDYRDDLNTSMYATMGTREFYFKSVENVGERNRETVVLAEERLRA